MKRSLFSRRSALGAIAACAATPLPASAAPTDYPRSYARLEAQARREGRLVVYSSTDLREIDDLLRAFRARHPQIAVDYADMPSREIYDRFLRETTRGAGSADLVFNSAMDLQIKLVNDGYAQAYASPEKPHIPSWAIWKDEAYGVTAEPIVFAYNRKLVPPADVPRSHQDLERLLRTKRATYSGKVVSYDVERSSTGYLFFTQDEQLNHDTWKLLRALGETNPKFYVSGEEMLQRIARGEHLIAYNLMSSYVLEWRELDPAIEIVFPTDYTLVMSRIAFIAKRARHPAAAKIFLDFLLSREGQQLLGRQYMTPVRAGLTRLVQHGDLLDRRAIHVGPVLIANLDQIRQRRLISQWKEAVKLPAR